ncbi:MAG: hypothetical protein IJV16_03435 [Lachnospiraceae bacterium]|nr:hypothetical protein [Lachnospiraceae bacterium]MBQ9606210.1 hypothetical protein [Lachnospiraceae bacterium]
MKKGTVDISELDTPPEKHELSAAKYFADLGKDIIFIRPSDSKGIHRPDFLMDGVEWELKSPTGRSKRTIENNFRDAVKQSRYIIFDLRRVQLTDDIAVKKVKMEFSVRKYLKRLLIIHKDGTLEDIS